CLPALLAALPISNARRPRWYVLFALGRGLGAPGSALSADRRGYRPDAGPPRYAGPVPHRPRCHTSAGMARPNSIRRSAECRHRVWEPVRCRRETRSQMTDRPCPAPFAETSIGPLTGLLTALLLTAVLLAVGAARVRG